MEPRSAAVRSVLDRPLAVDAHGGRFHVEWDPHAPVTPLGRLVFFSQFLATAGLFGDRVRKCPRSFTSNNAPLLADLLGTITLAILAGQNRYAHLTALRADPVNPQGLGLSTGCSEDSVRRAFAAGDPQACATWQTGALRQTWLPALRLVLDVQVRSGKQHPATHSRENLWRVWDGLPKECRPWLVCGDARYGHEGLLAECEARGQSSGVKQLVRRLESQGGWRPAVQGYAAVTSRPLLLGAVGRVVESGRPLTLRLTSTHAEAARAPSLLTGLSLFLSGWQNTAEQLSAAARWERIWARILRPWRHPVAALAGSSG